MMEVKDCLARKVLKDTVFEPVMKFSEIPWDHNPDLGIYHLFKIFFEITACPHTALKYLANVQND